jgi:glycosyl-4,4'-diaponeurosporenoate acyltransferase
MNSKPLGGATSTLRRWLHALALLAIILVFGASFALLGGVIGITSPWLVLLLMFYFLAIAKVAEPLFMLRMPRVLRPLRRWEREGDVYRRLGVLDFGRLLRQAPLRYLNTAVYLDRERRDPLRVRFLVESAEASHFWAAALIMPYVIFAGLNRMWHVVAWFSLAQVLVNVYPILHLRHIRGRLDRTIGRISAAQAGRANEM